MICSLARCNNNNSHFKECSRTSDKGGGATLVRLCLARVFFVRCCVSARLQLHLQQLNARRQIAPHLRSDPRFSRATLDLSQSLL